MTLVLVLTVGGLYAVGTYLLLQRKLSRIIIGLALLTHGANVLLITSGRRGDPALIGEGDPS
ncbi:MAG TPA: NADH-quinone oxidoreductase subunit K, partial [Actinomycetota bacterium]|nr:NADH-quinone oxidoreductase subunit K [Actinomycetota bacterium]